MSAPSPPLHLSCEVVWGRERTEARGFDPEVRQLRVAPDEKAPFPLYGFQVEDSGHVLAEWSAEGLVVFPPPGAVVEPQGPAPEPVQHGGRAGLRMREGQVLVLRAGEVKLRLTASRVGAKARIDHTPALVWSMIAAVLFVIIPVGFLVASPDPEATSAYATRTLEREREKQRAEQARKRGDAGAAIDVSKILAAPPPEESAAPSNRAVLPSSLSVQ